MNPLLESVLPGQRRTVLVVDDDSSSRHFLADALEVLGCRVVQAADGGEALRVLMLDPPDLIVTDLMMPGMDGLEFSRLARNHAPGIPLVLITACEEKEAAAGAMQCGATAFLRKPVTLADLGTTLGGSTCASKPDPAALRPSIQATDPRFEGDGGGFEPFRGGVPGGLDPALLHKATQLSILTRFGSALRNRSASHSRFAAPEAEGQAEVPGIGSLVHRSLDVVLRAMLADRAVLALTEDGQAPAILSRGAANYPLPVEAAVDQVRGKGSDHPWHGVRDGMPLVAAPLTIQGATVGVICVGRDPGAPAFTWADRELLEAFSAEMAVSLENGCLGRQLEQAFQETVTSLIVTLEARDKYTEGHSLRVAEYASGIALARDLPAALCAQVRTASLLHDLGKVGVRDAILEKPGRLTSEEWAAMRQHPVLGWKILEPLGFLAAEAQGVRHHHEALDGSGYPDGLTHNTIPLPARIIAVADAFDAMTTPRPYRPARSTQDALTELRRTAGRQFDPVLVETFQVWLRTRPGCHRTA